MNTESKEYRKIVKKIGAPLYNAGDKVKSTMFDGVATVKEHPEFNGFVWMYSFNELVVRCGQEYLRSAYEWVAYDSTSTPTKWLPFTGFHLAIAYADTQGNDWDVTSIQNFKTWHPEINLEVSK
jgi:hypothetical protein